MDRPSSTPPKRPNQWKRPIRGLVPRPRPTTDAQGAERKMAKMDTRQHAICTDEPPTDSNSDSIDSTQAEKSPTEKTPAQSTRPEKTPLEILTCLGGNKVREAGNDLILVQKRKVPALYLYMYCTVPYRTVATQPVHVLKQHVPCSDTSSSAYR